MLTFEDKILIKNLWECKRYSARRLITEIPTKNWGKINSRRLIAIVANNRFDRTRCALDFRICCFYIVFRFIR